MDYNENAPFLQTKKCKKTRTRSQEYRRPWEIGPREREHILQLYSHYALDENKKRVRIIYQPYVSEPIVFKGYRFIITERPTLGNLSEFIDELLNKRVNYVVRCSAPSFNPKILDQLGIKTILTIYESIIC
ncbi:hypothetical protein RF11_13299 [Thelohanellus kitauei]|uniref:Uncharacterized protein n=1 Tax=Thelohanellus kitauei TaxID=669202 RepID=A0A0C2JUS6_THEKT|nr:hypothetical protein RF11_13299 [Thelohanellus kitauei]